MLARAVECGAWIAFGYIGQARGALVNSAGDAFFRSFERDGGDGDLLADDGAGSLPCLRLWLQTMPQKTEGTIILVHWGASRAFAYTPTCRPEAVHQKPYIVTST